MADDGDLSGKDILASLFGAKRAKEKEAMSMASVADYVKNGQQQRHNMNRHNAQADAFLKAKFAACGMEGIYEPPDLEDEEMSPTLINCHFNGDQAVSSITSSLAALGTDQPVPGTGGQQPTPPRPGILQRMLPFLLGAVLTAGGFLLANYMAGDDSAYDMRAMPFEPFPSQQE